MWSREIKDKFGNFRLFHSRSRFAMAAAISSFVRINHISNFALKSITNAPDIPIAIGFSSGRASIPIRSEKRASRLSIFSTELGILSEWCARPRYLARIGRFTCHLRRNERERRIAAGEKVKDEPISESSRLTGIARRTRGYETHLSFSD